MRAGQRAKTGSLVRERWDRIPRHTPDGIAEFPFNGHADYFVTQSFSVGQYAGVGNDCVFGLSAQAKYWWDIPGMGHPALQ